MSDKDNSTVPPDPTNSGDDTKPPETPETPEQVKEGFNSDLQAEIDRYERDMAALQAEFNESTDETSPELTKKSLVNHAPSAVQEIVMLAKHGSSESVRLSASKYILDVALGKSKLEAGADGFEDLIKQLTTEKEDATKDKP